MKYIVITDDISSVYDTEAARIPGGRGRGGLVHPRGRAALRLAARAVAPDQGARDERRWRAAGAPAAGGPADPDGPRVPSPRDGRRARGRGGPARGARGRRARGRPAAHRHAALDRDRRDSRGDPRLAPGAST